MNSAGNALWTAADLKDATGGKFAGEFAASGVSIDTRTIQPGDLFVALVSETGDGHDHAAGAIQAGAGGVMLHRDMPDIANRLLVDDTLAGLTRLGAFARARFAGRVIAVTGSVGKTTTKEMSRLALAPFGSVHAAVASYNNHWGVPLTLARNPAGGAFCIVEIGMNHAGEIPPLAQLAQPHVAVITAVEAAHIGHLGGMQAIAEEKASIMGGLPPAGVAVLPADSPWLPLLRERAGGRHVLTFGSSRDAAVRLVRLDQEAEFSTLRVEIGGREFRLRLPAPGRHMAMNAIAALTVVVALGLDPAPAAKALESFVPLPGRGAARRLELRAAKGTAAKGTVARGAGAGGSLLLLDESYNANGASMRAALEVLRLQPAKRRVAVLGDMLELGDAGPDEHANLGVDAVRSADLVFTCGPMMEHLYAMLPPSVRGAHADDAASLAPIVVARIAAGDAVLVKGSLGSNMKIIVAALETQTRKGE
jgi:UDP-N-acetylmuramoyl-tripeptide--D-alanyl-D-alanine ligase